MIIVSVLDCSATAEHLHHHYHPPPPPPPSQTPSQPLLPSTSSEIVEVVDTEEPAPQQDFTLDLSPNSRAGRLAIRNLPTVKYSFMFILDFLDKIFSTVRNTLSKQLSHKKLDKCIAETDQHNTKFLTFFLIQFAKMTSQLSK